MGSLPERKASKKEVEYAVKRLDGVIGRITNAMKSTIQKIQTTLMKPEVKSRNGANQEESQKFHYRAVEPQEEGNGRA